VLDSLERPERGRVLVVAEHLDDVRLDNRYHPTLAKLPELRGHLSLAHSSKAPAAFSSASCYTPAITLDQAPFALPSTRNCPRTAVHHGAFTARDDHGRGGVADWPRPWRARKATTSARSPRSDERSQRPGRGHRATVAAFTTRRGVPDHAAGRLRGSSNAGRAAELKPRDHFIRDNALRVHTGQRSACSERYVV
jgi:hypothetical protein